MRDYGKVHTSFWSSSTITSMSEDGRMLAMYLLSSPHGNIAGVYRLPDGYICEDLQWVPERVSKGFVELFEKGFANRCETTKWVWICKHFEWNPLENPNQRKSALKIADQIPGNCAWKLDFMGVCGGLFGVDNSPKTNPSETLSKPFLNQEQEQEQEQEKEQERDVPPPQIGSPASPSAQPPKNQKQVGSRIPDDWSLSESGRAFCGTERPDLDPDSIAAIFADHWRTQPGKDGLSTDWEGTWRNWVRKERKASGAGRAVDVARITTPGPVGLDPELKKMDADARRAAPPPAYIRKQVDQLKTMGA